MDEPLLAPVVLGVPIKDEGAPPAKSSKPRVYASRWWVLMLFSVFSGSQGAVWEMYSPVATRTETLYGFNSNDIQLLINYGPICYVCSAFGWAYIIDKYGVKPSVLLGYLLVTVSAVMRLFATGPDTKSRVCVHVSQILNGLAGPAAMSVIGKLSEDWFPPTERITATSIGSLFNMFGVAIAFLDPYLVTDATLASFRKLYYATLGLNAVFFVAALAYFPAYPPSPPSASASLMKSSHESVGVCSVLASSVKLLCHKQFMLLALAYGVSTGVYGGWAGILSLDLKADHLDADKAGWIGFAATLAGCVAGVAFSRVADRMPRRMKEFLLAMLALGCLSFLYFALAAETSVFPSSMTSLFVSATLGGLFVNASIPFFYEASVEVSYPIPEGAAVVLLTLMNNIACLIFLAIPTHKYGVAWMNWTMMGSLGLFAVLLLMFDGKNLKRLNLDVPEGAAVVDAAAADGDDSEFAAAVHSLNK